MPKGKYSRPQKRFVFRSPDLEISMDEVYRVLGGVYLGPFRFVYSELFSKLYLQASPAGTWNTLASIDLNGNVAAAGSFTGGASFPVLGA